MNIKKILTTTTTALVVMAFVSPSFAASFSISGNGSKSHNKVFFSWKNKKVVEQVNEVENVNQIVVESNTGDNQADDNTGGDVNVSSGNVTTNITVSNAGAANVADVDDCGCEGQEDVEVSISGNGSHSHNMAKLSKYSFSSKMQYNGFFNLNSIGVSSNTGDNQADDNTGGEDDDDVVVDSGNVTTNIVVENVGASNEL